MLTRFGLRGLDWSSLPLHSIAVAAFPVLFLFAENAEQQVTLAPLWMPLAMSVGAGIAVLLVAGAVLRDWFRGGLLATLLLALFFSFGHVWNLIGFRIGERWMMGVIWVALAVVGGVLIWRGGRWIMPTGRFLNIAALLLVAFNVFRIASFANESATIAQAISGPSQLPLDPSAATKPDIYYIMLDRYANVDTLRDIYGFDNEPFMRELEQRGFRVARHSWANYFKTSLSVYSSMNMKHIDPAELHATAPYNFNEIHQALRDHMVVPSSLKAIGYDYVHLGSWWEPTATNIDADISLRYQESAEFSGALFSTTPFSIFSPPVENVGGSDDGETTSRRELARPTTLSAFEWLEESARRPGPTFVYAHILLPHPPYVFKADGSELTQVEARQQKERLNYIGHVQFANQRVLQAIDTLIRDSDPDPVIVLQADEGPWPPGFSRNQRRFAWLEASPEIVQQKFGILNAMRLPGVDPAEFGFNDLTSPVNEFRIVFNAIFDADLPLLPDVTYLSPDYAHLYDFVEYPRD
jgi:hypothetical protein